MAKAKITFGNDFVQSKVEVDGEDVVAYSAATLNVDTPGFTTVEIEAEYADGSRGTITGLKVGEPVVIEATIPDDAAEKIKRLSNGS